MNESKQQGPSQQDLQKAVARQSGARYFWVGVFVLLGLVSFITVLFLLTDPATLRGRYMVVTQMDDAGGVRRGDPIQMRGVNIGRVQRFEMTDEGRVAITMEIEGEWAIPVGSRATLAESGVFGGRTVEIVPTLVNEAVDEWDTIPGEDSGGGLIESAGELAGQAENVMTRIQTLLDEETIGAVQGTAREVETLAAELRTIIAAQRDELAALTSSLSRTAEGLEGVTEATPSVVSAAARADTLMLELGATTERLDAVLVSLDTVLGRMARGEGTLGLLSRDETLYRSLVTASAHLDSLLVDVRANPRRYVTVEIF